MPITPAVERVGIIARRIIAPVRVAGLGSAAAAMVLAITVIRFVGFGNWLLTTTTVLCIAALASPALVLLLFHHGLGQLVNLPGDLSRSIASGMAQAGELTASLRGKKQNREPVRRLGLVKAVYELGTLVMDSKGLLLDSVVFVRLANPLTLAVVIGALVMSVVWWFLLLLVVLGLILG